MTFPSLVGGVSLRAYDLVPSIIFAAVYGLLLPLHILRMTNKRFRTYVIVGSVGYVVEKTIIFAMRAAVANKPNTEWVALTEYMQLTIGTGFIMMAQDFSKLMRSILVYSTKGSESETNSYVPELVSSPSSTGDWLWKHDRSLSVLSDSGSRSSEVPLSDQPRRRFWFRRITDGLDILLLAALVLGLVGNSRLIHQKDSEHWNHENQALRYASSAVALLGFLCIGSISILARYKMPRVERRATSFLITFSLLLAIPATYRLVVMSNTTSSLQSTAPGSQNTRKEKVLFYVFHIVPEWTAAAILACLNVREIFQTGPSGDYRWRDETREEKEKREEKEREKALKEKRKELKWRGFNFSNAGIEI